MAITQSIAWCEEHSTDDYMWHTQQGHYQCDACWDDTASALFGVSRQYTQLPAIKE